MSINIQPPGPPVSDRDVNGPPHTLIPGTYTSLQPLSPSHSASLFTHLGGASNAPLWTFLPLHPLPDQSACDTLIAEWSTTQDPQYYAVVPAGSDEATGVMSFLNIMPQHRRLEIGWIILGAALQRTRPATEAFFLMLGRAFDDLGYQRVEWKANALNSASLKAAERLGFVSEGTFRKHIINKGKWRDTAWFSITDDEWPPVKEAFKA